MTGRDENEEPMATRIVYQRKDESWGWKLKDDEGGLVATNGTTMFATESEAREMADRIISGSFSGAAKQVSRLS